MAAIQVSFGNHRIITLQDEADSKLQGTCVCGDDALALEQPTDTPSMQQHLAYVCTSVSV